MAAADDTPEDTAAPIPEYAKACADLAVASDGRQLLVNYLAWLERESRETRVLLGWAGTFEFRGEAVQFSPTVAAVNAFYNHAPAPSARAGAVLDLVGLAH